MNKPEQTEEAGGPGRPPMGLTAEEQKVFRECRRESFFFRALPFGVTGMVITNYLIRQGTLSPHPRFGAIPKSAGAMVAGYIIGKISYVNQCKLKILQLENSPLGDFYRKRLSGNWGVHQQNQSRVMYTKPEQQADENAPLKDEHDRPDIDTERKQIKGLDDSLRPSVDTGGEGTQNQWPLGQQGQKQQQQSFTNYEDLRQANRAALAKQAEETANVKPQQAPAPYQERKPEKAVRRNKYGDIIEE